MSQGGVESNAEGGGPRIYSVNWQPAESTSGRGYATLIFIME